MIPSFNAVNKRKVAETAVMLLNAEQIPQNIIRRLMSELLWSATEDSDQGESCKYFGQPLWSEGALQQYLDNINHKRKKETDLKHAKVVLPNAIECLIYNLPQKTDDSVFYILDKFAHAVVLAPNENDTFSKLGIARKMPDGFEDDVMIRFRLAEIDVYNVSSTNIHDFDQQKFNSIIQGRRFNY